MESAQSADRDPGDSGPDRGGDLLGLSSERGGVSRPDASPGRGDHAEPGGQPRGDGAIDRHPAGDGAQRDAGAGGPAEHLGRGPQRHQVPVRLRHRLLGRTAGGDQPDRHGGQPAAGGPAGAVALEPHRRDRPLRARRSGLYPEPAQGGAGLGAQPRLEDGPRGHRRDGLRRDGQAVSGLDRHAALAAIQRHAPAGRGRDLTLECEHRRRHPHPGEPVAQRPRGGSSGQGDRSARPGQRRPVVRHRGQQDRRPAQDHHHLGQRQPDLPPQRRPGGRRAPAPAGDRRPRQPRTTSSRASS